MIALIAAASAVYRPVITVTISSNTANYTLSTSAVPGYVAGLTTVTLRINSGVYVYSLDPTLPALTIDSSFVTGDSVTVLNLGYILGGGGNGVGATDSPRTYYAAQDGGSAISTSTNFSLNNQSYIGGGGGGGGGVVSTVTGATDYRVAGGGGGQGGGDSLPSTNGANAVNTSGTAGAVQFSSVYPYVSSGGGGSTILFNTNYTEAPYGYISSTGGYGGVGGSVTNPSIGPSFKGGGGSGGVFIYNQLSGTSDGYGGAGAPSGSLGQAGQPNSWTGGSNGWVACGGGGGGWGQAGGAGAYYSNSPNLFILAPGAGGNGIKLNGKTITYIVTGTILGAVS